MCYLALIALIGTKGGHVTKLRKHASAALHDAVRYGADVIPEWGALETLGAHGRHPQNCERDFLRWQRRLRAASGVPITTYSVDCTLQDPRGLETFEAKVPLLLPHEMFHCVWLIGGDIWGGLFGLSQNPDVELKEFWNKEFLHAWVQQHPAFHSPSQLRRLLPISFHGDDVAFIKEDKGLCMSWTSDLCRSETWDGRFLMWFMPYNLLVKGRTVEALMAVVPYTMYWLQIGVFPDVNHLGEPFTEQDGWRFKMRGKPLAGGWRGAYSHTRGDMPFMASITLDYSFRHEWCCNRCMACKNEVESLTFTDGGPHAGVSEKP